MSQAKTREELELLARETLQTQVREKWLAALRSQPKHECKGWGYGRSNACAIESPNGMTGGAMPAEVYDGKQIAAGRTLAGLGIRELAAAAGVAIRTLHRLELTSVIYVAERKRHGHVQLAVWERIVDALRDVGVELLPEGRAFGSGVRWIEPRRRRA